jgi:hypothetical protein
MDRSYLIILLLLFYGCSNNREETEDAGNHLISNVTNLSDVESLANNLKEEILQSETELLTSGTSWYVSNNGDDNNSGRSPENSWATLSKVSNAQFSNGDAVFFERGGTWRGTLVTKGGVSYSAYGEGEKPKILGSLQNYSVRDKWTETETPNVYVYDQVLEKDAGILVFNNGEAHSYKKVVGIDGFTGSVNELKNDLEMYHNINDKRVYLYSDNSNPADRFSSIEICIKDHIIKTRGNNIKIDNLCIKYGGTHGIGSGSISGLKVTNCELGWIGGSIQHGTTRYGNAVEIWGSCKDFYVDHCYIYQVYDAGITHQFKNSTSSEPVTMENVTYSNNLIEYCIYSVEYFLDQTNSEQDLMKNILIKNNICRLAGYGWGWQRPNKISMNIQGWRHKNPAENFIITGNIFDRSRDMLIFTGVREKAHLPKMNNNVYIQHHGKKFGFYGVNTDKDILIFDDNIKKVLSDKKIDENPVIIFSD